MFKILLVIVLITTTICNSKYINFTPHRQTFCVEGIEGGGASFRTNICAEIGYGLSQQFNIKNDNSFTYNYYVNSKCKYTPSSVFSLNTGCTFDEEIPFLDHQGYTSASVVFSDNGYNIKQLPIGTYVQTNYNSIDCSGDYLSLYFWTNSTTIATTTFMCKDGQPFRCIAGNCQMMKSGCSTLEGTVYFTSELETIPWWKITTLMIDFNSPNFDPRIICYARSKNVRIQHFISYHLSKPFDFGNYTFAEMGSVWSIENQDKFVEYHSTNVFKKTAAFGGPDGINIDIEGNFPKNQEINYIIWMKKLISNYRQDTFANEVPQMITMAVGFVPEFYLKALDPIVDYFIPMAYDMNYGVSPAAPISDYQKTVKYIPSFKKHVSKMEKILLGIPWYIQITKCKSYNKGLFSNICNWDNSGTLFLPPLEYLYDEILPKTSKYVNSGPLWDEKSKSSYMNIINSTNGDLFQIQYESPNSLYLKIMKLGNIGGTAIWRIDQNLNENQKNSYIIGSFPWF
eukprot:gene8028-9874_t